MSYIKQAIRTKSDQFHPEAVDASSLTQLLRRAIWSLNELDHVKKALFYGKPMPEGFSHLAAAPGGHTLEQRILELGHTLLPGGGPIGQIDMLHGIIGKATEAGELLEALLLALNGEPIDVVNVLEEVGDGFWYDAVICNAINNEDPTTFEELQANNIDKLRKRYPDKFTEYDATHRDLAGERVVLESIERVGNVEVRERVYDGGISKHGN